MVITHGRLIDDTKRNEWQENSTPSSKNAYETNRQDKQSGSDTEPKEAAKEWKRAGEGGHQTFWRRDVLHVLLSRPFFH